MRIDIDDAATFFELEWDTKYFGVKSAKAIMYKPLSETQLNEMNALFKNHQFISIENKNSEPINAQFIGRLSKTFLADVNIQFTKKTEDGFKIPSTIIIHSSLGKDDQILDIADFPYSKFNEDPELAKRGGDKVYYHWILSSFGNPRKRFAVSNNQGIVDGFLLHSYSNDVCTVELIAVKKESNRKGIGTALFKTVEQTAFKEGYSKINVGTQIRNINAINFYHRVGCKQVGCHQIYHLWK